MRPLLPLIPLLLGATPVFDTAAIIDRDRLLDGSDVSEPMYAPFHEQTVTAELDGRAPREHIIITTHPVPEAAAETRIHPYRWEAGRWMALPTLACGGYMEPGYVERVDLEADGRDELLLVGDTDGVVPADLSVMSLRGDVFVDLVWGVDPGPAYAHGDLDGDGVTEIIGLPVSEPGPVQVLALAADGFLRGVRIEEPAAWLPRLLDEALAHPAVPHRFEGFASAMAHADAVPTPEALPALRARLDATERWAREPLLTLLARGGDHGFLVERLHRADPDDPQRELGRALAESTPGSDALVTYLGARGSDLATVRGLLEGALPVFARREDPRLRALVATVLRDPALPEDPRGDLLFWVLPGDPSLVDVLVEHLRAPQTPEIARLAAATAERTAGRFTSLDPTPWRTTLDAIFARSLIDAPSPHIRAAGLHLLLAHEQPPAADVLVDWLLREPDATVRRHLVGALPAGGPVSANSPALPLLDAEPYVRRGVHWWIAHGYAPERWLEGLDRVTTDDDLEPYAIALRRDPPRRDRHWATIRARAIGFASHDHARVRQRATELLGSLPHADTRQALIALLDDPVTWVRTGAAEGLARHADDAAVDSLLAHETTSRAEGYERSQLRQALGQSGHPRALQRLAALLSIPNSGARFALQEAGAPAASALLAHLATQTDCAARDTLTTLARVSPEEAVSQLPSVRARLCDEPDAAWLPSLIESFERAGALGAVSSFTEHPDRRVRLAALAARGRLLRKHARPR